MLSGLESTGPLSKREKVMRTLQYLHANQNFLHKSSIFYIHHNSWLVRASYFVNVTALRLFALIISYGYLMKTENALLR